MAYKEKGKCFGACNSRLIVCVVIPGKIEKKSKYKRAGGTRGEVVASAANPRLA